MLTASAEDADSISGLEMGSDTYLIKSFNTKDLLVRVRKLIEIKPGRLSALCLRVHAFFLRRRQRPFLRPTDFYLWKESSDLIRVKSKVDAAFEFITKMCLPYYYFHYENWRYHLTNI